MTHYSRYFPYPEFVDPRNDGHYRIADSEGRSTSGSVDKVNRHLWVPLKATGQPVVRHELAHVLWSPLKLPKVRHPIVVLHAVEDARINLGLENIGVPVVLDAERSTFVQLLALRDLNEGRAGDFVLRWVASLGTNVEPLLAQAAEAADERGAFAARLVAAVHERMLRRHHAAPVAPFTTARQAARELARRLRTRGLLDASFRGLSIEMACCGSSHHGDPDDDGGPSLPTPGGMGEMGSDGLGSGHMEVVEAPLTRPHPEARRLRRSWRAATEGAHPGALHRWAIDKAVFRRPSRRGGGTVLVDTSGSMSLDSDDVDAILDASRGAALVAIYSGRRDRGQLRVIARRGRRADREQLESFGGGNIVDAPALEWLARQQAPRLWVSDGGVTGIGDRGVEKIYVRCKEICRSAGIRRFGSADEAAQALTLGRVA